MLTSWSDSNAAARGDRLGVLCRGRGHGFGEMLYRSVSFGLGPDRSPQLLDQVVPNIRRYSDNLQVSVNQMKAQSATRALPRRIAFSAAHRFSELAWRSLNWAWEDDPTYREAVERAAEFRGGPISVSTDNLAIGPLGPN